MRTAAGDFTHPLVYPHAHGAHLLFTSRFRHVSDGTPEFAARYAPALARLYDRARAAKWHLGEDAMTEAAFRGTLKSGAAEGHSVEAYLDALHAEDLALAVACKCGDSRAWEP